MSFNSLNEVKLIGRLGKDPEVTCSNSGVAVAKFSLVTSKNVKKGDNYEEVPCWHNIVAFRKTAENIGKFIKKGSLVFINGEISNRSYEKDGVKKYISEVVAEKVMFLDSKNDQPKQETQPKKEKYDYPDSANAIEDDEDDSLPF